MRYWKALALFPLVHMLTACSSSDQVNELLCRAEYRYNTEGADSAIATVRELGHESDYVVGNNVARFLILRGNHTGNTEDFDQAKRVLDALEMPEPLHPMLAKHVSTLRFVAIANGSDPRGAEHELSQYCHASATPQPECLREVVMEIFEQVGRTNGTKNQSFQDFAEIFNRTYRSEFSDQALDVALDYSRSVVTSCGTHE